jgi:hypothetical protein
MCGGSELSTLGAVVTKGLIEPCVPQNGRHTTTYSWLALEPDRATFLGMDAMGIPVYISEINLFYEHGNSEFENKVEPSCAFPWGYVPPRLLNLMV